MLARYKATLLIAGCLMVCWLLVSGCEDTSPQSPVNNDDVLVVLPDAIGNYWVHDFLEYRDGALVDSAADSMLIENYFEWNGET